MRTLFRFRRTLMQMLNDKGYLVAESDINMSREEFEPKHSGNNTKRADLDIFKAKRDDSSDKIYVFFPESQKAAVDIMKKYTARMKSKKYTARMKKSLLQK